MALTLAALAGQIGGRLEHGDPGSEVGAVATLQHASTGDISFLANRTYREFLASTRATAVMEPSMANVKSGAYRLSRPLLLVAKGLPKGDLKKFYEFMLSAQGQAIVGKLFVPVK